MPKAVVVPKERAQEALRALKSKDLVDYNYKVTKKGDLVYIPVKDAVDGYEVVDVELEKREKRESLKECLTKLLGPGDWPRSFSIIGDIAVISLDEDMLKIAKQIAECIMKSQKNVTSVWAKLGTEGVERVAKLVHLGGERKTETVYKEYGLKFKVDIAKVYVNPSFSTEHVKIAEAVKDGDKVLDMFAGAGFFPIHIASRRKAEVVAIDINPHAVKFMIDNIELNKKKLKGFVWPVMADSRIFTRHFKDKEFDVVIMNLPHRSFEFLDEALRLAKRRIVMYVVGKEEEVKERFSVHVIRKVIEYAPYKYIWRVEIEPKN